MNAMKLVNKILVEAGLEASFPYNHKVLFATLMDGMQRRGWNLAIDKIVERGGDIKDVKKVEMNIEIPE